MMPASVPRLIGGALLACVAVTAAAQFMDRAPLIPASASVVKIEAVSTGSRFQLGSGVIVAPGKVVTNCHVTRSAERVQVVRAGVRWPASGEASDVLHDLCVLRVPRMEGSPVRIAPAASLKVGQPLMAIGYTGGLGQQASEGKVVALHRWSGSRIIQSTNWFNSGASGGGLFTADGSLVGILTFRQRGGAAHYFAAPADWLTQTLADDDRYAPVAPLQGRAYWELPADQQPNFLRAVSLEETRQWSALASLAEQWSRESSDDAEPPYLLGVAYDGLGRTEASIQALQHAVAIEPGYGRGWARLATIYAHQGRAHDKQAALGKLAALDPEQARQLTKELESKKP